MRTKVAVLPLLLAVGVAAAGPATSRAGCDAQPAGNDALQVSCALDASSAPRRFRFVASFSGGHDDTVASMAAALDGAALTCEDGSKTRLMGEDGDVSLQCRFAVAATAGAPRVLQVNLKWSHAQYTDFELVAE